MCVFSNCFQKSNLFLISTEHILFLCYFVAVTDRTALRDLNERIEKKMIHKTGGKKGAKYFLK